MKYAGAKWLQKQIDGRRKPYELSPLAIDIADIMGQIECGLYHWENVVSSKGWQGKDRIELNYPFKLKTGFFGGSLTLLVMLCHSKKIELKISPCSPTAIKLSFVRASEQPAISECIPVLADKVEAIA